MKNNIRLKIRDLVRRGGKSSRIHQYETCCLLGLHATSASWIN